MEDKACVVFGGSYGGMLAAWLRLKHPNTFQGALAASAPFLYFEDAPSAPSFGYGDITTEDFKTQLEKSPDLIKEAWEALVSSTSDQYAEMSAIFNTCTPIESSADTYNLYYHYSAAYQFMAMTDYPYPANFLEPMPAWPIKEAVKAFVDIPTAEEYKIEQTIAREASVNAQRQLSFADMLSGVFSNEEPKSTLSSRDATLFQAIATSTNVYFNYTENYPCTNISDASGEGNLDGYGWNILACN